MLNHISYSSLHLLACPYASFLRYQAQVKGPTTPWLALGNAVHYAIEHTHNGTEFSLERATALFLGELRRIIDDEEVFVSWPQMKKIEAEGIEMLGGYHVQHATGVIPQEPLELEKEFRLPHAGIEVVGKIDKLDLNINTGGIIVTDFKTGKTKPDEWFLKHNLQLTCYAWAVYSIYGRLPDKVIWHHLRTGEMFEATRTLEDIAGLKKMIEDAVLLNKEGVRFRIYHEQVCGQCDYSGFAKMGGVRPQEPICDDKELELLTVERLGIK